MISGQSGYIKIIIRLYKDNTFGVKNTVLKVDERGQRWIFMDGWFVICGWKYGVYLVYSDFGLCGVWYEFMMCLMFIVIL